MSFNPDQERDEKGMWTAASAASSRADDLTHKTIQLPRSSGPKEMLRRVSQHKAALEAHKKAVAFYPKSSKQFKYHQENVSYHEREASDMTRRAARGRDSISVLERLARVGHRAAAAVLDAFNPDQPRDERGWWGEGGNASTSAEHTSASEAHAKAAEIAFKAGDKVLYHAHESASRAHREAAQSGSPEASQRARQNTKGVIEADRESRELVRGERVPLKQGPTQAGGYKGNPAVEGSRAVRNEAKLKAEADIEAALASGKTYESIHSGATQSSKSQPIGREAWNKHPFEMSKDPKTLAAIRADEIRERQIERGNDPARGVFRGVEKERFNAGPSDPVHGGSGRGTPYNRDVNKESGSREKEYLQRGGPSKFGLPGNERRSLSPANQRAVERLNAATNMRWKAIEMRQGKKK